MIGLTFYQQTSEVQKFAQTVAINQAETFLRQVEITRKWNVGYGGVYVSVNPEDQTKPVLNFSTGDVTAGDGREFKLISHALMVRQLAEMAFPETGIRFRLTSLHPLRPENTPDSWESSALVAFERGETSRSGLMELDGQPFYRYMAPLLTEELCTKCHSASESKKGGVQGGISVSIPASRVDRFISERVKNLQITHGMIALAGLIALWLSYLAQSKLNKRLNKTKSHIQLAYLDSLTLLPNRRYYDAFVKREWKRANRHKYPLSMIMIDIDFFKAYNDSLGHVEGDRCLRQVARTLKKYFRRPGDLIARYGGEEFCVVAACDEIQIHQLAEVLRIAIETMQLPHPGSTVSKYVTISLGVATLIPHEIIDHGQLLLNADQALYAAKQSGRNRVQRYDH